LSQRDANTDLHPEAEPEPSLPSMESDEAHGVQGKGGVDRLGSFKGTAAVPGIHMNAPAESAAPLLGPAPSVTNMNSPKPLDQHVVVGRGGVTMHLAEDGSIAGFADPSSGILGKFDLTNQLMRAVGQNPYRYEQHRLAEETREERICRMKAAQEQNEREALFRLSGQLATIWNETSPVDLKRNLLFSLWDECREESTDAGTVSALAYQATIESFIRKHLPAGSALAFTNTELASLNQRRTSSRKFDPYATLRGSAVRPDAGSTAL